MRTGFGRSITKGKKVFSSLSIITQLQESSTFHTVFFVEKTEENECSIKTTFLYCKPSCQHNIIVKNILRIDSRVVNNKIILFPYKMRNSINIKIDPFYKAAKEKRSLLW